MITIAVVGAGLLAVLVALAWLVRWNPGWAQGSRGLLTRRDGAAPVRAEPALRAWEADLLAAQTGGPRGRERLSRKIEPILVAQLRDNRGLSLGDPEAVELLGVEWEFLMGGPVPVSRRELTVDQAVTVLLDRVGEGSGAGRA